MSVYTKIIYSFDEQERSGFKHYLNTFASMNSTQVCIIGAGPAGSMAALRLGKEGVPFILIDQDTFPRQKICGDGLSGKVPHIMRRLSPDLVERFEALCQPLHSFGMRFMVPGEYTFDVPFIFDYNPEIHPVPGYTVRRETFDAFMVDEARKITSGNVITGQKVDAVERKGDEFMIIAGERRIKSRILIDASGTLSKFSIPYLKPKPAPKKTALAVRSYYSGVSRMHKENFIELYFLRGILPGYFWIFPLKNGMANVGLGLRKDLVLKKKINLSKQMDEIIRTHPLISKRFEDARKQGKNEAYSLPLGNPNFRISGDSYMLAGDAAHLVDPLTGEGVGNALYSGYIAAEQAISCFEHDQFDDGFMKAYDKRIKRVLGKEMTISKNLQRMLHYPGIVRILAKKADGNKHIARILSSMYTDLDYRKKLVNPLYLLRVLLNK